MGKIEINNIKYKIHPIYDLYAVSKTGNVIHIVKQIPMDGHLHKTGYLYCMVRKYAQKNEKSYQVHRFVWECYNGLIPDNKVIDHINDDRKDNRLCNLQLMTTQQNNKKAAKNQDHTFVKYDHQNQKCVKSINQQTKEVTYYNSMYAVQQHLGINAGTIKMASDKLNNVKTGISKKDGCNYKFEYINKEDLPVDYRKSGSRKSKMSDKERKKGKYESYKIWQQKQYKCPTCGKIYKNNYKYHHNKICDSQKQQYFWLS